MSKAIRERAVTFVRVVIPTSKTVGVGSCERNAQRKISQRFAIHTWIGVRCTDARFSYNITLFLLSIVVVAAITHHVD